ncbi:MAG: tRNA pseudouridine(38-40) synthase TruA [Oscillospiraceae bacterium]|jgi:tRNA pseudouridine38-40 synthase|nr:tRNA pseudouridine(38-40) synthase TruA [Oscillospiraceae bacterium]
MNTMLTLRFDGTHYHGWQPQKEFATVCGTVKAALEKTLGRTVTLHGCGRTDAGVHAEVYAANFRGECSIPHERLPFAINSRLPRDIAVLSAKPVPDDFHAINSCMRKQYTYRVYTSRMRDPLREGRALHWPRPLDIGRMRGAARDFTGTHDFACVRTMGTPVKSTVRTLYAFDIEETGGLVEFTMRANGFLYNMARALAGTLLWVSEGKVADIPALIASGDRAAAGPVLPAHGLYMTGVWYA